MHKYWMTLQQLAEELQVSTRTLHHYRKTDPGFPRVYDLGHRNKRVLRKEVEEWLSTK